MEFLEHFLEESDNAAGLHLRYDKIRSFVRDAVPDRMRLPCLIDGGKIGLCGFLQAVAERFPAITHFRAHLDRKSVVWGKRLVLFRSCGSGPYAPPFPY